MKNSNRFEEIIKENTHYYHSILCQNFNESFALWESYSEIFETQSVAAIPESAQLLRLRYEDLLQEPNESITKLIRFVDLHIESQLPLFRLIDSSRAYAFQRSTNGKQEFENITTSPWMKHYGYMPSKRPMEGRP